MISSTPMPSAKLSRMTVAVTRVPVMQALSWQTSGLLDYVVLPSHAHPPKGTSLGSKAGASTLASRSSRDRLTWR